MSVQVVTAQPSDEEFLDDSWGPGPPLRTLRAWTPRQEAGALELAVTTWGYWLLLGLLAATFGATFWVCSQKRTSFGITRQSARQEEA